MTGRVKVMDACSLIAFLRGEKGSEVVESLLTDENNACVAHAVNLCEVFYDFMRSADEKTAENAISDLESVGLISRNDIDLEFWQSVAKLKARNKASLADCFAIALANRLGGEVVTSDHHEFDILAEQRICAVQFIRDKLPRI